MKKYLYRLVALAVLAAVFFPLQAWLERLDRQYAAPVRFTLRPGLPAETLKKYGLEKPPRIARVFLAGRFSDWSTTDRAFELRRQADGSWSTTIALPHGRHPYKFAVFPEGTGLPAWAEGTIWVEDTRADEFEPDTFGGRNSVLTVKSVKNMRFFVRFAFLALALGIAAFSLLELALRYLMHLPLSLRTKLSVIFLVFLVASNLFFIAYSSRQRTAFTHYLQVDKLNIVHVMLRAAGVDFSRLGDADVRARLKSALEGFLGFARLRQDYTTFSNEKLQFSDLTILDPAGRVLATASEPSSRSFLRTRFGDESGILAYRQELATSVFEAWRRQASFARDLFSFSIYDYLSPARRAAFGSEAIHYNLSMSRYYQYNGFLYPIFHNHQVRGHYFVEANAESYSNTFQEMLFFNLALFGILFVLALALIRSAGNILLAPINRLIEGIARVRADDYGYEIQIGTRDEVERLGQSYNFLRERLSASRQEVERYTMHLEAEVEDRSRDLKRAYSRLKEDLSMAKSIQERVLSADLVAMPDLEASILYRPVAEVGGDFYDIFEPRKDHLRVFLADATGHGIQAALVTMLLKSEYEKIKGLDDPIEILQILNQEFLTTYRSLTVFFTGILVDVDFAKGRIKYTSAGHSPQCLLGSRGIELLSARGKMVGVVPNPELKAAAVDFKPGDQLLLFTDGLYEQFNPEGHELGESRLLSMLDEETRGGLWRRTPAEITQSILQRGEDFRAGGTVNDDITLICVRLREARRERRP